MAESKNKPRGLFKVWGELAELIEPTEEKIRRGWGVEVPPHQWFNWFWNHLTRALSHINQRGIPEWDIETEYLANKSYVQGSDGTVYRAKMDGKGNNPVTDRVHWEIAFVTSNNPSSRKDFMGWVALAGDITAQPNYKYYFTSTGTATLPATAQRGDTIEVGTSPNVGATIVVEGGKEMKTKLGNYTEVNIDIETAVLFVFDGNVWEVN